MSDFVDISSAQGPGVDLAAYHAAGHDVIAIKSTEGTRYANPYFPAQAAQAAKLGLRRLRYDFADPGADPAAEANFFLADSPPWLPSDVAVYDVEAAGAGRAWAPGEPQRFIDAACSLAERKLGRPGLVYTGLSFLREQGLRLPAGWAWWIADYGVPALPSVAGQVAAWQYTDAARVAGIPGACDASHLYFLPGAAPVPVPEEDTMLIVACTAPGEPTFATVGGVTFPLGSPADEEALIHAGAKIVKVEPGTFHAFRAAAHV